MASRKIKGADDQELTSRQIYQHEYYLANKERILENQRKRRARKREAQTELKATAEVKKNLSKEETSNSINKTSKQGGDAKAKRREQNRKYYEAHKEEIMQKQRARRAEKKRRKNEANRRAADAWSYFYSKLDEKTRAKYQKAAKKLGIDPHGDQFALYIEFRMAHEKQDAFYRIAEEFDELAAQAEENGEEISVEKIIYDFMQFVEFNADAELREAMMRSEPDRPSDVEWSTLFDKFMENNNYGMR